METKPPFSSPVKEYSMETYVLDEDNKQVLDNRTTFKYDEQHKLSQVYQYDPKTGFSETSQYSYDQNQRLVEVVTKIEDGEQKKRLIYEYQDDQLDKIMEIAGDYKIVNQCDDYGNPTEKQTFTSSDVLISTSMYVNQYDDKGRLVEKHTLFPSSDSEWVDKFSYDEAGRLIEEQKIRNKITSIIKHSYNAQGDLILSDYNPGESNYETLKREITYSPENDIIEIKEYRKGWCYQDRNEEFALTGVFTYSYVR